MLPRLRARMLPRLRARKASPRLRREKRTGLRYCIPDV
jgi:hypothetical protein